MSQENFRFIKFFPAVVFWNSEYNLNRKKYQFECGIFCEHGKKY